MGNPGGAEQLLLIRGCLGGFPEENGLQHPRILRVCRTRNPFVQGAPQGPEPAGPNQRNSLRRLCPGFPQPEADAPGAVIRPAVKAARIGGAGKKSERSGQPHRGSDPVLRNVLCLPDHAPRRVPDAVRRHRGAPQGHRPCCSPECPKFCRKPARPSLRPVPPKVWSPAHRGAPQRHRGCSPPQQKHRIPPPSGGGARLPSGSFPYFFPPTAGGFSFVSAAARPPPRC